MASIASKLLVVLLISCVCFLILEQVSRCFLFGFDCFNYDKMSNLAHVGIAGLDQASEYPGVLFEYKPNIETYNKLAVFKTNSQGLKDREYTVEKPRNTFRVVVLGGSYTAASGVDNDKSFHSLLEERLNKETSAMKYEFINFGHESYHADQKVAVLRHKALKYEPDLILFCLGAATIKAYDNVELLRYKSKPRQNTFFKSYALELLKVNTLLHYGSDRGEKTYTYSEEDIRKFEKILQELSEISIRENIAVCIAIIDHDYTHLRNSRKIEPLISKYGFHLINTIPVFKDKHFLDYIIYRIDKHPNAEAHKIFADVIYDYLVNNALLGGLHERRDAATDTSGSRERDRKPL
jgi:hypothetical protein